MKQSGQKYAYSQQEVAKVIGVHFSIMPEEEIVRNNRGREGEREMVDVTRITTFATTSRNDGLWLRSINTRG